MPMVLRDGLIAVGVWAGYFASALVGTVLVIPPSNFAIIWPATAFLISVLLILPARKWWWIAGVIPTHFYLAQLFSPEAPFVVVTTEVLGNLFLAFATALAVRFAFRGPPHFRTFGSVLKFAVVAGIAVPAVVNALILSVHLVTGRTSDFSLSWLQWMIAGFFPTITIPPLLFLTAKGGVTGRTITPPRVWLELALLQPLLFALSFAAFGEWVDAQHWPALYLVPLPLLLWAAVRMGVGGTCLSLLVLAAGIVAQALRHQGPFAAQSPVEQVVSLQIFLITISVPLTLLAALMDERRRTLGLLRHSEARMQVVASSTDTGLWQWDSEANRLWLTDNCRAMFRLASPAFETPLAFLDTVHPDDQARVGLSIKAALVEGTPPPVIEFRVVADGETRWFILHMRAELDDAGKPLRVSGVFRDVTESAEARLELEDLRRHIVSLQDDERRRISQELHDSTAQHLAAAGLNLYNVRPLIPPKAHELLDEISLSIREATTEIRTFSYLLHPPQLDDEGLCRVLEQYVPGFERRTGVRTSLRITPLADQFPSEHQHAILRIAQESLGNVHRHAQAKRVSIDVRCLSGNVHLVIRDDGAGIRHEQGKQLGDRIRLGVGIPAMTARVRQLGGRIDVNGGGGRRGTTVHVAIPLRQPASVGAHNLAH